MKKRSTLCLSLALAFAIILASLALIPLSEDYAAASQEAGWPGYQRDYRHTGRSSVPGPASPDLKWSLAGKVNGGITVGEDGSLFAGSGSCMVALQDRGDSSVLSWYFEAGSEIATMASLVPGGDLVFGCENGDIYKLSPSGELLWKVSSGRMVNSHPAVDGAGSIYLALGKDLVKLSTEGETLWSKTFEHEIEGTPVLDDQGRVYLGAAVVEYDPLDILKLNPCTNWYLHSYNPDGSLNYRYPSPSNSRITCSPSIDDEGRLLFGTCKGEVICLAADGGELWRWSGADGSPVEGGFALDGAGDIYFCDAGPSLVSLDGEGGQERWRTALGRSGGDPAVPVVDGEGRVYAPGDGVQCFSAVDGSPTWSLDKDTSSLPVLALGDESTLYFAVPSGPEAGVYAVGPRREQETATEPSPGYEHAYYLAEGTTREGFLEYIILANPNPDERGANVQVTYLMPGGVFEEQSFTMLPESRSRIDVSEAVGPGKDVSVRVASTLPITVERPMFFVYEGAIDGGHDAVGVSGLFRSCHFAEVCTRDGFFEYLRIQNTSQGEAEIKLEFMIEGEGLNTFRLDAPPTSRTTVNVRDMVGHGRDVAVKITADKPVMAERPMYFVYQGLGSHLWTGGHNAIGATSAGQHYNFAEGTTRSGFEEWLCMQNPSPISEIVVRAEYFLGPGQGPNVYREYRIPPSQRLTVCVNHEVGPEKDVSVKLESDMPFVAERPMYFDYKSTVNGGSNVIGTASGDRVYHFAYGSAEAGFEQWLCVLNPSSEPLDIDVTYYLDDGEKINMEYRVEASTRFTRYLGHDVPNGSGFFASVEAERPIIAEMATYFKSGSIADGWSVLGRDSSGE